MRTIFRDIVGGFIFSKDNCVLLGKTTAGGVYEGSYVVPGGGIEDGETQEQALIREMQEETGIDIATAEISRIDVTKGENEKTLQDTGERVLVKMTFFDYRIILPLNAEDVTVAAEDDWCDPRWFKSDELREEHLAAPTLSTLRKIGFLPY